MEDINKRLEQNPRRAWSVVQEITGADKRSPAIIVNDEVALSETEAAEKFNKYFVTKIKKIKEGIKGQRENKLKGAHEKARRLQLGRNSFSFHTINERDVVKAIKRSKPSNCPDIDGISPLMLKLAPDIVAIPLAFIINTVIRDGEIPKGWKVARVLPLHKKLSKNAVENYRPVSILSTPSKILEEVLRQQLSRYLEQKGILPSSQFGFRCGRSTVQATGAALHDWQKARRANMSCGALQFDLSAAFDMISADLLIKKLQIYGACTSVEKIITSYLTGRRQRVDYGDSHSSLIDLDAGSPQGSCLSPLLYITLVADLDEWISEGSVIAYADDSSVYSVGNTREEVRRTLENAAREVLSFFSASSLAANASKTKFIMFGHSKEDPIKIGDMLIKESEKEELLGFTYNKSLTWKDHLSKMESELRKRIGVIRRLSWHLPQHTLVKMIEPLFTSKLR